jgi:hypothetical protein
MKNGSVYRGTVNHMEEVVFWLDEQAQTPPVRIAYNQVSKINSVTSNRKTAASTKVIQNAVSVAAIGGAVILMVLVW